MYRNYNMQKDVLFIGITSTVVKGVFLPCLDPPLQTIDDLLDYIVM
jgi:hypothetical protein